MKANRWIALGMCLALCALLMLPLSPRAMADDVDTSGWCSEKDLDASWDEGDVIDLSFSGAEMTASGGGATMADGVATISEKGTYRLTGTLSGRIVVNVDKKDDVRLLLAGVSIVSAEGPALYVQQCDKTILTLVDGTQNSLTDTALLTEEEDELNAALFAREDITINGGGALSVSGNVLHGVLTKNDLRIVSGDISVSALGDALRGKDSVRILDGSIAITTQGDGIVSTNTDEADRGWVGIAGGSITVTTGGGASEVAQNTDEWNRWAGVGPQWSGEDSESTSMKGVKAAQKLLVLGGQLTIDSADDALHSVAVSVSGGELALKSGDDGIHADETLAISGGSIAIGQSYEGLEGTDVLISGGSISVVASDDGVNAAGGADGSAMNGGWGGKGDMFAVADASIQISGGLLVVNASGDGLDSNGSLTISGGETYVSGPTISGNGALDYNGTCTVTGGVLVAAGASGMAQAAGSCENQAGLMVYVGSATTGEITVTDASGETLLRYTPEKQYECVFITAPGLQTGQSYTIACGGASVFGGSVTASLCSVYGGTLTEGVSGGMGGGFGGDGHGGKGGPGGGGRR